MKSIGIGVDSLAGFSTAMFVELYHTPGVVIQAMDRFHRLSSGAKVLIAFLLLRGTLDEAMLANLRPKLSEYERALGAGQTGNAVYKTLGDEDESDDNFFARMRGIVEDGEWD